MNVNRRSGLRSKRARCARINKALKFLCEQVICKSKTKDRLDIILKGIPQTKCARKKVNFDFLKVHTIGDQLHKNVHQQINSFIKIVETNFDSFNMTKLVYLIEVTYTVYIKKAILGMRILESLGQLTSTKFTTLHDQVTQLITELSQFMEMDLIKIYICYILWEYELRRK